VPVGPAPGVYAFFLFTEAFALLSLAASANPAVSDDPHDPRLLPLFTSSINAPTCSV
jgi:hypothetical protein